MNKSFRGNKVLTSFTLLSLLLSLGIALYPNASAYKTFSSTAHMFMICWLLIAIIFCLGSYKEFVTGFLISLFSSMVAWRIAAIYDISFMTIPLTIAFLFFLGNFIYCAMMNIQYPQQYLHKVSLAEWQLTFVRLYIGLNFIPHFTEKLFAGSIPHMNDVNAFISLGISNADRLVWLAGLCEFGAAIALTMGLLMRIGAIGGALYLLIATYLGHHFSLGFIWAGPGGGWEFCAMWMVLILSFALTGYHAFSLDQQIEDKFTLPTVIKKLL
jgi:putative oxidoreductase